MSSFIYTKKRVNVVCLVTPRMGPSAHFIPHRLYGEVDIVVRHRSVFSDGLSRTTVQGHRVLTESGFNVTKRHQKQAEASMSRNL